MIPFIDRFIRSKAFHWLRILQFALAILIFSSVALMPQVYVRDLPSPDYSLHFLGNVLLFLSAWIACKGRMKLGIVIALLIPYSLIIELAQWLAPSRHVDSADMAANIAGLFFGLFMAISLEKFWAVLNKSSESNLD